MLNILKIISIILPLCFSACTNSVSNTEDVIRNDIQIPAEQNVIHEVPINKALTRITKKPFGIKISPATSPVTPEKFSGYHTGADFEIFTGEEDTQIDIYAICDGPLILKKYVSGYGGVAIQKCAFDDTVTVLYGHLKLESINLEINQELEKGDNIGFLGKGYSPETDYERKHLHLGVHKGGVISYLGYVQTESQLDAWIDPLTLIENM